MKGSPRTAATLLLASLLLAGPAAAQDPDPVADARVRIFGQNGRAITMYTNAVCRDMYDDRLEVVRSVDDTFGTLLKGAPDNVSLGIPITDTVRNMKSVMFSRPNYQELLVAGGQPLIFDGRIEGGTMPRSYRHGPDISYHCERPPTLQFTPEPGKDYEVVMTVSGGMCRISANEVHADGGLAPAPLKMPKAQCPDPKVDAPLATSAETTQTPADPIDEPYNGPLRDWKATVLVGDGAARELADGQQGDLVLRVLTRGRAKGAKIGELALKFYGGGGLSRFAVKNPKGGKVDEVQSPAVELMPGLLRAQLAEYFSRYPGRVPVDLRTVQPLGGHWSLIYQERAGSTDPYELRHEAMISFSPPLDGMKETIIRCMDERRLATLDEWEADDYAKVRAAAQEFAGRCIARFATQLPKLFPPAAAPVQAPPPVASAD